MAKLTDRYYGLAQNALAREQSEKRRRAMTDALSSLAIEPGAIQQVQMVKRLYGVGQLLGADPLGHLTTSSVPKTDEPDNISSNNEGSTPAMTTDETKKQDKLARRSDPSATRYDDLEAGDIIQFGDDQERWRVGEIISQDGDVEVHLGITRISDETDTKISYYPGRGKLLRTDSITITNLPVAPGRGVDFESVILHQAKKQQIIDTIRQVDNHDLIFTEWGFDTVFEKGTAVSMLFYGPPGTGKTLMGQAVADRYGYALKVISTAEIETPEPGGAERNIKAAFKEAADSKTVLLFDECDSLITDRKHVGMILAAQINALLTELEHYKGIVIFTTNRLESLDPAFDRRLSLKLEFDMPDAAHRKKIWARMFPAKAPLAADVDFEQLAEVEIAGGHIKNVVLKAARMAANLDVPNHKKQITQAILVKCLKQEVKSNDAFTKALEEDAPLYGNRLSPRQRSASIDRVRKAELTVQRG